MSGKNQREFQKLVQKYLDGTASREEQDALDRYYLLFRDEPENTSLLSDEQLSLLERRMENGLFARIQKPVKISRMWPRIAAVAAAVAIVVFGAGLYVYKDQQKSSTAVVVLANDIPPGKLGATLTLASGKKINLRDAANGEIAKEAGIIVSKTADGQIAYEIKESSPEENQINTLTTAKGETYVLTLPDKSKVWMNAASSLTYTATLKARGVRRVTLIGEAYFQIAKDKAHPFIVESRGQQVQVLGTHFNISAYGDEPVIKTTLLEGSVKVTANRREKTLKPNQQALFNGTDDIQVSDVEAEYDVAWKNGFFLFNGERLESIMIKVARWYNVEVEYADPALKSKTFIGTISRFEKVSKVLNMLERTEVASFKIDGNKIIVDRKK
jgi:transmembrane sensor